MPSSRPQVGDELECKGPIPKLPYTRNMKKSLGFVVGGSGLTPALQVGCPWTPPFTTFCCHTCMSASTADLLQ